MPWTTLGIAYPPGMAIRCDFALGEPDASGTKTAARVCWSNRSPIISADAGMEAMLLPGSWGYITLK